jgi:hypothetical protein
MPRHRTITVAAARYADAADSLPAAADAYVEAHPDAAGYDLAPRWADDERDRIALDVPGPSRARLRALRAEAAAAGDLDTVAAADAALSGDADAAAECGALLDDAAALAARL